MTKDDLLIIKNNLDKTNKQLIGILNDKYTERQIKRTKTKLRKESEEYINFIKDNKETMSCGEIDKYFNFEAGTTKIICELNEIKLRKNKNISYSQEEIDLCKKYYPDLGLKETAKLLNCSESRIRVLCSKLGLKRNYQYSKKEEKNIIKDFNDGLLAHQIAVKYNRTPHAIENFLSRRGLTNSQNTNSRYYISSTEKYMIEYITTKLGIEVPDKSLEENRPYYWNVIGKYEIDLPIYIKGYKFAIEYDGYKWHKDRTESDSKKNKELQRNGFIVLRISSKDHDNNFNDLTSLNNICQKVVDTIQFITSSL